MSEALQLVSAIAGALFVLIGVIYTARVAKGANQVDSWARLTERLEATANSADARAASALDKVGQLETRITELEGVLHKTQRALRSAVAYIERLLDAWSTARPGVQVPTPPLELHEHLDQSVLHQWTTPPPADPETP